MRSNWVHGGGGATLFLFLFLFFFLMSQCLKLEVDGWGNGVGHDEGNTFIPSRSWMDKIGKLHSRTMLWEKDYDVECCGTRTLISLLWICMRASSKHLATKHHLFFFPFHWNCHTLPEALCAPLQLKVQYSKWCDVALLYSQEHVKGENPRICKWTK